jgi:NADH-quinone oxidoreductase subunit N
MPEYEPVIPGLTQLIAIFPEIVLTVGMCVALIVPLFAREATKRSHAPMLWIGLVTCIVAIIGTAVELVSDSLAGGGHFFYFETLAIDRFSQTVKLLILAFTCCVFWQYLVTGGRKSMRPIDTPDYVSLVLGAALGMCLMASASNFLMMFVAMEAASFPSYALAGFRKHSKLGPEASLKYILFGAAATAIMLYGLSMLYGQYGSLDFHVVAAAVAEQGGSWGLALGMLGLVLGVGFKLSAVPVHFWCPDVFEGASIEITTFLSFASKGAAVALLLRIMMNFGAAGVDPATAQWLTALVGIVGGLTATWGNLAALRQDNLKRMLAYSSIGHAGYMMMACSLVGRGTTFVDGGIALELSSFLLFYLFIYLFMNLGAFTVAGLVEQATGSLRISDMTGMWRRNMLLGLILIVCLASLFGMPPLGGFFGKVLIGLSMWRDGQWWLVAILLVNTVISAYYYLLRPALAMFIAEDDDRPAIEAPGGGVLLAGICAVVLVIAMVPQVITSWTDRTGVMILEAPTTTAQTESVGTAISSLETAPPPRAAEP